MLGFDALQLSTDRDPNAPHAEPLTASMITLKTLMDENLIAPQRPELVTNPPRIAACTRRSARAGARLLVDELRQLPQPRELDRIAGFDPETRRARHESGS